MPNKDKSLVIKQLNNEMDHLYGVLLKKVRSQYNFKTKDKEEFVEYINRPENSREHYLYEYLVKDHVVHFVGLSSYNMVVTLNFPPHASNYTTMCKTTRVYIRLDATYSRDSYARELTFQEFRKLFKDYHYMNNFFNEFEVYERFTGSPVSHRIELFKKIIFSDENKRLNFIETFKEEEVVLRNLIEKKNKYIDQRRKNNKTKKDNKNKNKGHVNGQIKANEKEIQRLQREIQRLRNCNESLKNQHMTSVSEEDSKAAFEYQLDYQENVKSFLMTRLAKIRQSDFGTLYQQMLLEKESII